MVTNNILICAVNYKNYPITEKFLNEVNKFSGVTTYLLDNSSDFKNFESLQKFSSKNIHLLKTSDNLGYFGGINYLIKYLGNEIYKYDFVIVSNNDIEFEDKDIFKKLKKYPIDPSIGCIAPTILLKDKNIDQNPLFKSKITNKYILYNSFFLSNYYLMKLRHLLANIKKNIKSNYLNRTYEKSKTTIFAPHGSFIILTKYFFLQGGYIDTNFFLYGEELSIAYQCANMDLKIIKDPGLRVVHNEHQTTSNKYSRFVYKCQKEAFYYIFNKYYKIT
ncbi:MAG: hypothetical protein ACNS60_04585 [Candidatus Cyclobacteriaceae bacterium M2_1C_046]